MAPLEIISGNFEIIPGDLVRLSLQGSFNTAIWEIPRQRIGRMDGRRLQGSFLTNEVGLVIAIEGISLYKEALLITSGSILGWVTVENLIAVR